jgi:hypothetical protein
VRQSRPPRTPARKRSARSSTAFSPNWTAATGPDRTVGQLDALLRSLVVPVLALENPLLIGAGLIAAPGSVQGRHVHFAWWLGPLDPNPLRGSSSEPSRLDLSTRGYADYLRDFRTLEWYSIPESTNQTHITGPYVDHLCTCDYILTLTMPAEIDGAMVGVVGADIQVKRLEGELLPLFYGLEEPIALVNQVGRVIVSTDPRLAVGSILPRGGEPASAHTLLPCGGTPLSLAVFPRVVDEVSVPR